jgi:hypothetical protein
MYGTDSTRLTKPAPKKHPAYGFPAQCLFNLYEFNRSKMRGNFSF